MEAYLDNAATTKVCPEAAEAAITVMTEGYGNPSSTHTFGRAAAKQLEAARQQVAKSIGGGSNEIFFTSGGTESINWALLSGASLNKRHGGHIISSMAEHSAGLLSLDELEKRGFSVTRLKPERNGSISAEAVASALREDTILVSLMLVNNETGAITDIPAIAKLLKSSGSRALFHCDAVQGFQKIPFTAESLGAELISISGHKIHAPKGIGALYIRGGEKKLRLPPLLHGGMQEGGRRAGTQALSSIAAFGIAAEIGKASLEKNIQAMQELKTHITTRLTAEISNIQILSGEAPHIISLSLPYYKSEVLMNYLESRGVYVSKSSACKKGGRSYVLEAAGHAPAVIDGALRIGLSRYTSHDEAELFCTVLKEASESLYPSLH